ncbi:unnamed protein product [Mycena citricolor]|uniref:Uncharacterized protein n=1 Tax=Mycena citricolor TaxID=2018698 RepID=A0AAD2HDQ4_9AGAR|nr:unnamed protein product [Mycena citricolor]CAK5273001.1 unnamed protein product [Mycena citricolor]
MSRSAHHLEYASPLVRAPSPASTVGSVHGPDQTSDDGLDDRAFERKMEEKLKLRQSLHEEEIANKEPLIRRPGTAREERDLSERIIRELRAKVTEIEDNELFEQTMLRGSQAGIEQYTIPTDVDAVMLSMMPQPGTSLTLEQQQMTNGPWNQVQGVYQFEGLNGPATPSKTPAKRATKGKGKSRK